MVRRSKSSRIQRNLREKNQRDYMKDLLRRLASLIPLQTSKLPVAKILNEATSYIKQLEENTEGLKRRKAVLKREDTNTDHNNTTGSSKLRTQIKMTDLDSTLEVNLICGLDKNFMLYEIISILEEEGAEVTHATQLNAGDRFIWTIKSKAIIPRIGIETSRVEEKLKELVL